MYYIVEVGYVGPNADQDRYVDADKIEITTRPLRTNQSGEICTEGWCGTTNDWAFYAHGEYPSVEEARAAIRQRFGQVRDSEPNGDAFEAMDEAVVEVYKHGRLKPMSARASIEWAYDDISKEIGASTSDDAIEATVGQLDAAARQDGYQIDQRAVRKAMEERRQDERMELEED